MKKWLIFLLAAVVINGAANAADLPSLEGLIEPSELVEFSSQIPGILEIVSVERGDLVKKGQIVAQLKSGVESAAARVAEARVDFGKRKALRNEELYKKKLISSRGSSNDKINS